MKKLTILISGALFAGMICWQSCKKGDFEDIKIAGHDAEFAFPLFNTDLLVSDLIGNILEDNATGDTIIVNPDNTITLFYSGDVTETKATNIATFLQNAIIPVDSSFTELPVKAPDGVTVQLANLSGGTLIILIRNTLTEKIHGKFYIPQLTKNGQQYEQPFEIEPGQSLLTPALDLKDWTLSAQNGLLTFHYDCFLPDGTQVLRLPPGGGFPAVAVTLQNLTFYYLQGYWGKVEYPLNTDTIEIDINQTNLDGNVKVKNPKVTITVFNSWGFPTRGLIKYLRFRAKNGDLLELQSPLIQAGTEIGIDFAYPSYAAGEVGQTKETIFYFDETNSNIAEIFNSQPTQMIYEVIGLANANADPNLIGFITDSSSVRMNVKVELLLEGQLKDFPAEQDLNLDFSSFADSTGFESAEFKLVTENKMPFTTAMQIYFRDLNDNNIDSLFDKGATEAIRSAPVNAATGLTTGQTRTETFIPFTAARFENLRLNAKKAYLKAAFSTAEDGTIPVKILNNQGCVVKMGIRLKR